MIDQNYYSKNEKKVILMRILTDKPKTLGECAKKLNLTRERIRQIEAHSIRKMLSTLRRRGWDFNRKT
mgnify:CR=1 FL=1